MSICNPIITYLHRYIFLQLFIFLRSVFVIIFCFGIGQVGYKFSDLSIRSCLNCRPLNIEHFQSLAYLCFLINFFVIIFIYNLCAYNHVISWHVEYKFSDRSIRSCLSCRPMNIEHFLSHTYLLF